MAVLYKKNDKFLIDSLSNLIVLNGDIIYENLPNIFGEDADKNFVEKFSSILDDKESILNPYYQRYKSHEFDIIVKGKGGHAAIPQLVIDPIIIASQIVTAILTIISRSTDPVDKALISITKIHGGTAHNVIDDEVKLSGTVRTFKPETRSFIEKRIKEIANGIAKAHGAGANIEFDLINKYPPTINSKKESEFAAKIAIKMVGEENVNTSIDPSMGGEDFSYLLNQKPGSYLYIGQGDKNHKAHLHTTKYDFNDNLLPIGVNYWVNLVKEYFAN